MWRHVDLVWTDVSEERIASIFRVEKSPSEDPAQNKYLQHYKTATKGDNIVIERLESTTLFLADKINDNRQSACIRMCDVTDTPVCPW
jgi:hypothetical protein